MLMTILLFAIFSTIASPNQGGPRILKMMWLVKIFKPIRVPSLLSKNGYIRAKKYHIF